MNRYTFSTQSGKAYYCNSIPGFIWDNSTSIIGQLVRHSFEVNKDQSDAWENQISELQHRLEECGIEEQKRYLVNSYRVLLTRARQGMVMFVPKGVDAEEDPTRDHTYYDKIYDYLLSCGISVLAD